jgi:hypothetical protein
MWQLPSISFFTHGIAERPHTCRCGDRVARSAIQPKRKPMTLLSLRAMVYKLVPHVPQKPCMR